MSDIDHKKKKLQELSDGNDRSYAELLEASHGQMAMDASSARVEMFIDFLEHSGIMSEEQRLDFEIAFHERIEERLNEGWEQLREAQARARIAVPKKKQGLVGLDGKPLTS